jgi:hypothetical protein
VRRSVPRNALHTCSVSNRKPVLSAQSEHGARPAKSASTARACATSCLIRSPLWAGAASDNPRYLAARERLCDGMREAGVAQGCARLAASPRFAGEQIVAFGRNNTIAPAMVSPRRASSRKSSRILITPGSTRTEARIPSRLRLRTFALIAFRPRAETLTVAFGALGVELELVLFPRQIHPGRSCFAHSAIPRL